MWWNINICSSNIKTDHDLDPCSIEKDVAMWLQRTLRTSCVIQQMLEAFWFHYHWYNCCKHMLDLDVKDSAQNDTDQTWFNISVTGILALNNQWPVTKLCLNGESQSEYFSELCNGIECLYQLKWASQGVTIICGIIPWSGIWCFHCIEDSITESISM